MKQLNTFNDARTNIFFKITLTHHSLDTMKEDTFWAILSEYWKNGQFN